ncbi:hypothetical protein BRYFOR_08197 [Marvinbryantia formatexigens DSM 14469]|uniref:Uncharacterized protein n=1 Tax=Marvinbryantia formatexigens DSM 14469 TaxID=478749 RepID=C6LHT3_9FIRM|nr:hypothetical protein BRYFOR_08197 [Marvinbryantia formatexigens DSM 14469]
MHFVRQFVAPGGSEAYRCQPKGVRGDFYPAKIATASRETLRAWSYYFLTDIGRNAHIFSGNPLQPLLCIRRERKELI